MTEYQGFRRLFRDPRHAGIYDETRFSGLGRALNNWIWLRAVRRCLEDVRPQGIVLDLPCGTGRLAALFRTMGVRAVGVDLSLAMLARSRSKGEGALVEADAERLPLKDGAVDGVVSLRFLHHPRGDARARILGEMLRVARRFAILDVRYHNRARTALRRARRLIGLSGSHKAYPRLVEIRAELASGGFRVQRIVFLPRLSSDNCLVVAIKPADGPAQAPKKNAAARIT